VNATHRILPCVHIFFTTISTAFFSYRQETNHHATVPGHPKKRPTMQTPAGFRVLLRARYQKGITLAETQKQALTEAQTRQQALAEAKHGKETLAKTRQKALAEAKHGKETLAQTRQQALAEAKRGKETLAKTPQDSRPYAEIFL
jgi:hypothetical protein